MKKSHLLTAAVVAALGGYLAYDLRAEKQAETRKQEEARIFAFKPEQVNEFRMQGPDGTAILLQRSEDGWKLTSPLEDKADDVFVDDFVRRLVEEKSLGVAKQGEGVDESVYGLHQPRGNFGFKTQAGDSKNIAISKSTNFEGNGFARLEGDSRILIVSPAWNSHLDRTAHDFRDKRLFRGKIADIRGLRITSGGTTFEILRKDNIWSAPAQPAWELDQNRVRELLSMINETRVVSYLHSGVPSAAQKATWGLQKPVAKIEAQVGDDRKWIAEFSWDKQKQGTVFVSDPAFVMGAEAADLQKFGNLTLDGLRDKKKAFDVDLASAARMEWVSPLKKTVFVKKDSWKLEGAGESPDSAQLQKFVDDLRAARAVRYATAAETKSFRPVSRILISDETGKKLFEVEWADQIHDGVEKTRLARTNLIPEIFHLSESTLSEWSAALQPKAPEPAEAATTAHKETP